MHLMPMNSVPMSRRATIFQIVVLTLFLLLGVGVLFSATSRLVVGAWSTLGALKVMLLGAALLLFGAAGLWGAILSNKHHRPSLLARAYYHSRFGRLALHSGAACVVAWLALRVNESL